MAEYEDTIAVDEAYDEDSSSGYGSSVESETTSLKSSICDYVFENGRRYHRYGAGSYILPNDETEQDRLDMHHHIFLLLLDGKLHLAPLDHPQRILDVGTGTGIWALDMGESYPSAEVVGTDLSPIQPSWIWPNVRFEVDDAEREWTFAPNHFDYIHSRNLAQSIRDWPRYFSQMYRAVKPGGYIEVGEMEAGIHTDDNSLPEDSALATHFKTWRDAATKMGIPPPTGNQLKRMAEAAGFVDVTLHAFKHPWSPWPKDPKLKNIGRFVLVNAETGFPSYSLALYTRVLGMTHEKAMEACENALNDVRNKRYHTYNFFWTVVGKKPENPA